MRAREKTCRVRVRGVWKGVRSVAMRGNSGVFGKKLGYREAIGVLPLSENNSLALRFSLAHVLSFIYFVAHRCRAFFRQHGWQRIY